MKTLWHYTCNNKVFYDKFEAIKESHLSNQHIYFHEPEYYKTGNWAQDCSASWQTLLKNRAIEIRDTHRKVNIFLSGGCDSKIVCKTFVENQIPIDEIVIIKSGIESADQEQNHAIDFFKSLNLNKTKLRVLKPTILDYKRTYSDLHWYEQSNFEQNGCWFRLIHNQIYNYLSNSNDTVADVFGIAKPKLRYVNNEWWLESIDVDQNVWTKNNSSQVSFHAGSIDIMKKQCYMAIEYIEKNISKTLWDNCFDKSKEMQAHLNYAIARTQRQDDYFIAKNSFLKQLDINGQKYFAYNYKEELAIRWAADSCPDILSNWKNTCDHLSKVANGKWYNQGRLELGYVGSFANFYSLTSGASKTVDELFPNGYF